MLIVAFLCSSPLADFQFPGHPYLAYKCLLPSFPPLCISYPLKCHRKGSDYPKSKAPHFYLIVPLSVYIDFTRLQLHICKLDAEIG